VGKNSGGLNSAGLTYYALRMVGNKAAFKASDSNDYVMLSSTTSINDNNWHFLIATIDRSTDMYSLYVDGILEHSVVQDIGTFSNTTSYLEVGRSSTGSTNMFYFNGSIDQVRIYNRSLTASEIKQHYRAGLQRLPDFNDARYKSELKIKEVYSSADYSRPYPNINKTYVINSQDPTVRVFTESEHSISDSDPDLELSLHMDEGADNIAPGGKDTEDASGNSNHGVFGNGTAGTEPTWTSGRLGKGLEFDGVNDYVDIGNNSCLHISNTITIEAWIYPIEKKYATIVTKAYDTNGYSWAYKWRIVGQYLYFNFYDTSDVGHQLSFNPEPKLNEWSYIVTTYDEVRGTAYLNGNKVDSFDDAFTIRDDIKKVLIGADTGLSEVFNGSIDEVKIYSRALSAEEVKQHYLAGAANHINIPVDIAARENVQFKTPANLTNDTTLDWDSDAYAWFNLTSFGTSEATAPNNTAQKLLIDSSDSVLSLHFDEGIGNTSFDASGNGNDGTLGNATAGTQPTWTSDGIFGGALEFDGVDDFVNVGNDSSLDLSGKSFTLAVWAQRLSQGSDNFIISQAESSSANKNLQFGFRDTNTFTLGFYGNDLTTTDTYVDSNWHFWVGTYDATTNSRKIYRDSIEVASDTATNDYAGFASITIGNRITVSPDTPFNGSIDEIKIYDRALSAEEVKQHYEARVIEKNLPGVILYNNGTSEPVLMTSDNLKSVRQEFENVSSSSGFDRFSYDYTFSESPLVQGGLGVVNKDFMFSLGTAGVLDTTAINAANTSIEWSSEKIEKVQNSSLTYYDIYDDDLVLDMPFEDASDVDGSGNISAQFTTEDLSGMGNTGTIYPNATNGPNVVKGVVGKALEFDGVDDYVSIPTNQSFVFGENDFAVVAWIKHNGPAVGGAHRGIVAKGGGIGGGEWGFYIENTANKLRIITAGQDFFDGNTVVADNSWHHVILIRKGTDGYMYVDGSQDKYESNFFLGKDFDDSTDPLKIGWRDSTRFFNGSIDEVKIYSRALSAIEIKAQYKAGLQSLRYSAINDTSDPTQNKATHTMPYEFRYGGSDSDLVLDLKMDEGTDSRAEDQSGYGNWGNLTAGGTSTSPTWSYDCKSGACLEFDGVDDYVNVSRSQSLNFSAGDFSLEAWIKPFSIPSGGAFGGGLILHEKAPDSTGWFFGFDYEKLKLYTKEESATSYARVPSPTAVTQNEWNHVVAIRDGETIELYINGKLEGSATGLTIRNVRSANLEIGSTYGNVGSNYFNGSIDEVKIYKRALTAAEIKANYQAGYKERGFADDYHVGAHKLVDVQNYSTAFEAPIDQSTVLALKFDSDEDGTIKDSSLGKNDGTLYGGDTVLLMHFSSINSSNYTLDESAYDNDGKMGDGVTSTTMPTLTTGKWGNGLEFDGVDDYVNVSASTQLNLSKWAITAWVYGANFATGSNTMLAKDNTGSGNTNQYWLRVDDWGEDFRFNAAFGTGSGSEKVTSSFVPQESQWYHIVYSFNGTNNLLYINGTLDNSTVTSSSPYTNSDPLTIGMWGNSWQPFNGSIDEVAIYNRSLSAAEVAALYNAGKAKFIEYTSINDESGKGGNFGDALTFDGVNDYVYANVTEDKITTSLWYKNASDSSWTFVTNVSGTTYVNGSLGTPDQYPVYITGNDIYAGKTGASSYYNGSIDDIRIYNRALSAEEIYQHYIGQAANRTLTLDGQERVHRLVEQNDFKFVTGSAIEALVFNSSDVDWSSQYDYDQRELQIQYTGNAPSIDSFAFLNSALGARDTFTAGLHSPIRIRFNVSDADGSSDLSTVKINITYSNGTTYLNELILTSSNQIASITNGYQYEYNLTTSYDDVSDRYQVYFTVNDSANMTTTRTETLRINAYVVNETSEWNASWNGQFNGTTDQVFNGLLTQESTNMSAFWKFEAGGSTTPTYGNEIPDKV